MGLDIRVPIGMMFSVLGPVLIATGFVNGTKLNVQVGGAMLAFGAAMLLFGLRAQRRAPPPDAQGAAASGAGSEGGEAKRRAMH